MSNDNVLPELKEILGSLIFGSGQPLTIREMRECLVGVAKTAGGQAAAFAEVREPDIRAALALLKEETERSRCGMILAEIAGSFRFQTTASCGPWLRHLLNVSRPNRLSQPALETLAIIAYRQPVSRPEIEGVRGVNVDHIIKSLLEMQLVRIVGRSELAGRPFLYGTTQSFLEHFGLRDLTELRKMEPMLLRERERQRIEERIGGEEPAPPASGPGAVPAESAVQPEEEPVKKEERDAAESTSDEKEEKDAAEPAEEEDDDTHKGPKVEDDADEEDEDEEDEFDDDDDDDDDEEDEDEEDDEEDEDA